MSHYADAARLKQQCDRTGDCTEYQTFLAHEDKKTDGYAAQRIQQDATIAGFIVLAGILFITAGRVPTIRRFVVGAIITVSVVLPFLLIEGGAAFIGLIIAFSSCFKRSCSGFAEFAVLLLPALALLVSVPLARSFYRRRHAARQHLNNYTERRWRILGSLLIALALLYAGLGVLAAKETAEQSKADIRRSNY